jgi:hypothetical protein
VKGGGRATVELEVPFAGLSIPWGLFVPTDSRRSRKQPSAIADAAMGMAYASALGDGESFTTLETKINFLKPVWNAKLTAEANI